MLKGRGWGSNLCKPEEKGLGEWMFVAYELVDLRFHADVPLYSTNS